MNGFRAGLIVRAVMALVMSLTIASIAAAQDPAPAKIDLNGTWIFSVETDAGTGTPTVTIKQDGEKISGHYSSATFGEVDFTGTLKGTAFEFKFGSADVGEVVYKGTAENSNAIKGAL